MGEDVYDREVKSCYYIIRCYDLTSIFIATTFVLISDIWK